MLRPMAKHRINNALPYLGFGTVITAPGNWVDAGQSTSNGQPPLPLEKVGGGVDVRPPCTVDVDLLCYRHSPYLEMP